MIENPGRSPAGLKWLARGSLAEDVRALGGFFRTSSAVQTLARLGKWAAARDISSRGGTFLTSLESRMAANPFLEPSTLPFGLPVFGDIDDSHYRPAFAAGMSAQRAEVAAIAGATTAPDFD